MTKPFNTILTMMLIVMCTVGCQSAQNNSTQHTGNKLSSNKSIKDFDQQIKGKYWKLIKLAGQPVVMDENQQREIHFKLNNNDNKINGFAGCNNFFGTYELEENVMRVKFSQMATTMMACPDVNVDEQAFLEALDLTDNYRITKDSKHNDILQLNVGRRASLAIFKAVYFD